MSKPGIAPMCAALTATISGQTLAQGAAAIAPVAATTLAAQDSPVAKTQRQKTLAAAQARAKAKAKLAQ